MPFPIQVQRFTRLLQRRFGLQGHVGLTLLEDVSLMVPLTGDDPAAAFHKLEKLVWTAQASTAVAGQFSAVGLSNPTDSKTLVWLETVGGVQSGAGGWRAFLIRGVADAAMTNVNPRDGRWSSIDFPFSSAMRLITQANAVHLAAGNAVYPQSLVADVPLDLVLPPGDQVVLEAQDVNTSIVASFRWREWPLAPGEDQRGG